MTVSNDELFEITTSVFDIYLHLEIDVDSTALDHLKRPAPTLQAVVQIAGAWDGAVILHCTQSLATLAAREMLDAHELELDPLDVRDAIGELTNMIAGNVKSLLSEPSHISLPAVSEGTDYGVTIKDTQVAAELPLRAANEYFHVTVRKRNDPTAVQVN